MEYCKKCKISYETGKCVDPEMDVSPCPLCLIEKQLGQVQARCRTLKTQIDKFKICEECQNNYGYCDKDRSHCKKLV